MSTLRANSGWMCGIALLACACMSAYGNTDSRWWTLASGESIHAELVKYDVENDSALLRIGEEEERTFALDDFSAIDGAWLLEWAVVSAELDALRQKLGGTFSHYQHNGKHKADFYVYTPSKYTETQQLPMLILFHPGGKGARYVKRFMVAAEALDLIVVSSDAFRNTGAVWNEKDDDMLACFRELLPVLETTVPHDARQRYMGGSSGGAQRAYHFSAKIAHEWAGIFANGGWIGGPDYYDFPFPEMRVAVVNGHRDPANAWIKRDAAVLEQRGCAINVFAFEGGHQVPPPQIQFKALEWLIKGDHEEVAEEPSKAPLPAPAGG